MKFGESRDNREEVSTSHYKKSKNGTSTKLEKIEKLFMQHMKTVCFLGEVYTHELSAYFLFFKGGTKLQLISGSWVAAWLSETVLRGRGPGASGFESHRRGRIFSKEGTSAGPWMCVFVFQGLTVGWWKEERQPGGQQGSNPRPDGSAMDVCVVFRVVLSRKEKGEEKVGVGGRGKYPGAPSYVRGKKRGKNKPTARYPIDQ
jgi:hypothetical protein